MPFRPSPGLTIALFSIGFVFARLGLWQLDREQEKQALFDQFEQAPRLSIEQALQQPGGFARVEAYGRFDKDRHILLDNKIFNGRAGVHVYTPFYLQTGGTILVNRGWLPMSPDRRQLPAIPAVSGNRLIAGMLRKPSLDGHRLGDPDVLLHDNWPQLVTYFDMAAIGAALENALAAWVLQLNPDDSAGFEDRQWQAAVMRPEVHRAYALQWFSLMLTNFIIWIALSARRGQRIKIEQD